MDVYGVEGRRLERFLAVYRVADEGGRGGSLGRGGGDDEVG